MTYLNVIMKTYWPYYFNERIMSNEWAEFVRLTNSLRTYSPMPDEDDTEYFKWQRKLILEQIILFITNNQDNEDLVDECLEYFDECASKFTSEMIKVLVHKLIEWNSTHAS